MITPLDPFAGEFDRLFTEFRYTAYRLETLQRYAMPYEEESFRLFLAGESRPNDPEKRRWVAVLRAALGSGKRMQRVHVVTEPLSDYMRFELTWGYEDNVRAGEDIRIYSVKEGDWPAGLVAHDYWLFDSRQLVIMRYDNKGALRGADLIDDPAEVVQHNYWRDLALYGAVRYVDYEARRRNLRLGHFV